MGLELLVRLETSLFTEDPHWYVWSDHTPEMRQDSCLFGHCCVHSACTQGSPSLFGAFSSFHRVLLCFINPILGNRYVRSRGYIVSEPRETHPRSEIADVPTSPCPPLDNLGCPDPHPAPYLRRWLHWSPPLPLRTDPLSQVTLSRTGPCHERVLADM